jgi:hypothetical protein
MGNDTQRYGADSKSPRPAWANWLIVGLVLFAFGIGAALLGTWTLVWLLAVGAVVCLVGAGVAALMGARRPAATRSAR